MEPIDHIGRRARNGESMNLTKVEAMEQLAYELRNQRGHVTYESKPNSELDHETHGDGIVVAKIGGQQVDHYIYHDDDS